jgi:hypothetical protein
MARKTERKKKSKQEREGGAFQINKVFSSENPTASPKC